MTAKLTATQTTILKTAAARPDGNIEPLPSNLRGGSKTAVIDGLLARDLITKFHYPDHVGYYLTDAAYAAVGRKRKVPAPVTPDADTQAAVSAAEANWAQEKQDATKQLIKVGVEGNVRPGTKLATVIDCLRQPGGTTIDQIMQLTHWQAHTVRGAISGMVKKKLGLAVESRKGGNGQRTYRLA